MINDIDMKLKAQELLRQREEAGLKFQENPTAPLIINLLKYCLETRKGTAKQFDFLTRRNVRKIHRN